jgi:hypothetical protein
MSATCDIGGEEAALAERVKSIPHIVKVRMPRRVAADDDVHDGMAVVW